MIAACIPALKQLFEKVLGRMGLLSSQRSKDRSGYINHDNQDSRISNGHNLDSLRPTRSPRTPLDHDLDGESVDSILPNKTPLSTKSDEAWERDVERHNRFGS